MNAGTENDILKVQRDISNTPIGDRELEDIADFAKKVRRQGHQSIRPKEATEATKRITHASQN